jgi:hypothetical protein
MNCAQLSTRLEDYLDGSLGGAEAAACASHVAACASCAARLSQRQALRAALRGLETPEPRPGFIDAALARAVAQSVRSPIRAGSARRPFSLRDIWLGVVLGGAVAAGLAVVFLRPLDVMRAPSPMVTLAMNEIREVGVLIDSDVPLENATIRIIVSGGIALQGYDDRHELAWQTSLDGGPNLVSLPVVARVPGEARIVAIVEHAGKRKRVAVDLEVQT